MKNKKKLYAVSAVAGAAAGAAVYKKNHKKKSELEDKKARKVTLYEKYIKRVIDIICASLAIIVFSWLYVIVAILVRVKLGSPVLFTQPRPGKDEKIFKMYKFRTMTDERDENGELLPDEIRLTKFGMWLRSTSLDELPEAFNILKGDMSLVGTRPPTVDEWDKYELHHRARLATKPGLTGMWQVSGRSNITDFEEVVKLDKQYISEWTMGLDIKILFKTVQVVFKKEGSM